MNKNETKETDINYLENLDIDISPNLDNKQSKKSWKARFSAKTQLIISRHFKSKRGLVIFLTAIGLVISTGSGLIVAMNTLYKDQQIAGYNVTRKPKPTKYYSQLTGLETDEVSSKRPITAIMIENSPDARPQSGLKDAGLVYEAVAEGGITRFIALYQEARPNLIGPVRSVRPYYVEWASAYDPSVAHIGGSSRALKMIRSGGYGTDLDQFFNSAYYWRATDRYAPHNVYTSFDKLDALNVAKNHTSSNFDYKSIKRVDPKKSDKPDATSIDINVSTGYYTVHYDYSLATNNYARSEGGKPHVDREGGPISADVVIGMKVPMTLGFEDGNREQITTTGSGEADIFQNGTVIPATWHKSDIKSMITFTDKDNKNIELNRGKIWVTALANTKTIVWK
jgi:hypothetical protein